MTGTVKIMKDSYLIW